MLLVAGALAGARSLNELVVEAFAEAGPAILHITGERDYESVRGRVQRGPTTALIPETERIGAAYSAADLVLARAGSSVWELAAAGKPAVLVPYPFATGDHQARNAEHFVRAGGAIMVRDLDLDDVPDHVRSLLDDPARLEQMGEAMLRAARPDAADEIAEGLIELGEPLERAQAAALVRRHRRRGAVGVRAARARLGRRGRRLGPRRDAVPRGARAACRVEIAPEPVVPDGWEVVVSAAYPEVPGSARAEFLAELVGLRRSIVVAGTHGKGTTAAMIAFVLRETGRDPAWLIGAPVPAARRERGRGGGLARGRGRRVGPLRLRAAGARSRSSRTSSSTTTREFRSLAELERRSRRGWRGAARRSRRAAVRAARSPCRASTTAATRARRSRRSSWPASRGEAAPALARFTGTGRRFEVSEAGGVTIVDDYGHHPAELAATIAAVREAFPGAGCACSSSRTSSRARATSPPSSPRRWPGPTTSR